VEYCHRASHKHLENQNALKHGLYTAEAIAARRAIRALLRDSRELLERF
jgi:hypothetical protein